MASKNKGLIVGRTNIDLTPQVYKDMLKSRALKKNWILGSIGAFAACFLATSILFVSNLPLRIELDSAMSANSQLEAELGKYQEVNLAVDQMGAIQNKLNSAAGGEINWSTLISSIESMLPSGTSIKSIGINTDGTSDARGAAILLSFVANSPLGYADTLNAVESAAGVSNVQIGGMKSSGENSYEFAATFDYDSSIKTNRFPTSTPGGN